MSKDPSKKRKYNQEDVLNLFIKAGGCCTFCKKYLFEEWMTHMDTNIGEKCHIRAFALYGPRGKDTSAYKDEINGYQNLVLGCPTCHSGIDKSLIAKVITIEKIKELKNRHEETIRTALNSVKNMNHQIVKYCYPIGKTKVAIDDIAIRQSAFDSLKFTESNIINLSGNELEEGEVETAIKNLNEKFNALVLTRLSNNESLNICLYSFAPIYLLIYLGTLLNEKFNVIPFVLRRNPLRWNFDVEKTEQVNFSCEKPKKTIIKNEVALVINSTAKIKNERVKDALKDKKVDIWEINSSNMDYDSISTEQELQEFSALFKNVVEEIGLKYGKDKKINLFPATANAVSTAIGRCLSDKSQNKLVIFDSRNNGQDFIKMLEI